MRCVCQLSSDKEMMTHHVRRIIVHIMIWTTSSR